MLQTLSICFLAQTLRNTCGDQNPARHLQPKKVPPGQGGDQKRSSPLLLTGNPSQSVQREQQAGEEGVSGEGTVQGCRVWEVRAALTRLCCSTTPWPLEWEKVLRRARGRMPWLPQSCPPGFQPHHLHWLGCINHAN